MDSTRASVSLNGVCVTASSNPNTDSANFIPHYLRPSTGSCHDICKYGRRRDFEEQPAKPLHNRTPKLSIIVPTHGKKEAVNHGPSAVKPSPDAKSFSPRAKNHSPRWGTSSDAPQVVKRGSALPEKVQVQVRESYAVGSKMPRAYKKTCDLSASIRLKPVMVKPSPPSDSSDRKQTRNNDVDSGRNTKKPWIPAGAPLSPNKGRKTARVELLSPRKDQKRVKTDSSSPTSNSLIPFQEEENHVIKNSDSEIAKTDIENIQPVVEDQTKTARSETDRSELEFESITDAPSSSSSSSSSHGEDNEESDKVVVSQRKRNHNKRRRKNRVVKFGDKHSQPIKLKFGIGNSLHLHEENNVPRRHKFKRTRVDVIGADDKNKSVRIGSLKASRTKDKHRSSKNRRRRARYGKPRILVLEDIKGDSKRNNQDNDDAAGAELLSRKKNLNHQHHHLQRKKDVQYLFNYVIEETASKLAERRKGMVKSLVGVFETLISQMNTQMLSGSIRNTHFQAHKCLLRVAG